MKDSLDVFLVTLCHCTLLIFGAGRTLKVSFSSGLFAISAKPNQSCDRDIGIGARLRRSVLLDSTLFTGIAVTLPATKSVMRFGPVWFGADRCTRGLAAPHGQTGLSQWPRPMRGLAQCSTPSQLPQHLARCALFRPSPPCDDGPPDPVGRP